MEFPIFPLSGAVLFPKTTLPLNIFEKRYLDMVDYALANKRLIGMIQTKESNELYGFGCLGKITSFNETEDGRYLISLEGLNIFEIKKELKNKHLFRMIEANLISKKNDNENTFEGDLLKKKILEQYKKFILKNNINFDLKEIQNLELDQLVKFIVMVSPLANSEKQMCLETKSINELSEKLLSILEINISDLVKNKSIN